MIASASTARTPIGKAYRGAFNATAGVELAAPILRAVIERARVEPGEVEELTFGCGYPEGATGGNVARRSALRAGLPVSSAASMVSRFCASGLEAIASAARRVMVDGVPVCVAGGLESISLVQPNVGAVLDRRHMAEHFELAITDTGLAWSRKAEAIVAEVALVCAFPPKRDPNSGLVSP